MPGDTLVEDPMGTATKGITIEAPLEKLWPWIVQIGSGRAGWYSYDWIDNGGHPSARSILSEHQHLAPGDIVPAIPGATDAFIVAFVEPPRRLVLTVPDAVGGSQVSYEFHLQPLDNDHSRLVMRGRISRRWPTASKAGSSPSQPPTFIERVYFILARIPKPLKLGAAYIGHHFMESRMLHNIKRRAEAK